MAPRVRWHWSWDGLSNTGANSGGSRRSGTELADDTSTTGAIIRDPIDAAPGRSRAGRQNFCFSTPQHTTGSRPHGSSSGVLWYQAPSYYNKSTCPVGTQLAVLASDTSPNPQIVLRFAMHHMRGSGKCSWHSKRTSSPVARNYYNAHMAALVV